MSTAQIIYLIILVAAIVAACIILYWFSKRQQKKQDEQQSVIDSAAQTYDMLIIDKKKIRLKESGLPQMVIDGTPWYARRAKVPVVKVKVGPKVMLMVADNGIYDMIPVKKTVKATVAGIYITDVKGIRGPLEKPVKKKNWFQRMMGEK